MDTWTHQEGDTYVITGRNVKGKRFAPILFSNPNLIRCYNVYRGTCWLVRDGKRIRVQTWYN